jgi:hypothetical protein
MLGWSSPASPAVVRFTSDGGLSWNTLAIDYKGGSLIVPASNLPAGSLRFEIILADRLGEPLSVVLDGHP